MAEECVKVIRLSPVAWQHISLVGKYEFTTNIEIPNLSTLMPQLISSLDQVVAVNQVKEIKEKTTKANHKKTSKAKTLGSKGLQSCAINTI
jgi:purine nucleoside permease